MKKYRLTVGIMAALLFGLLFASCDDNLGTNKGGDIGGGPTITVPGDTLAEKLAWLDDNMQSGRITYLIEIYTDETIASRSFIFDSSVENNITIILRGIGGARTISSNVGFIFFVGQNATLILDNNITLRGRSANNSALVRVSEYGTLVMNSRTLITGNTNSYSGGGVHAYSGTFIMNGGEISGNYAYLTGGGMTAFSTVRIVTGTIYGTEADTNLRNTFSEVGYAAALSGAAEYGTFRGATWNSAGTLGTTDDTIRVVNGVLR